MKASFLAGEFLFAYNTKTTQIVAFSPLPWHSMDLAYPNLAVFFEYIQWPRSVFQQPPNIWKASSHFGKVRPFWQPETWKKAARWKGKRSSFQNSNISSISTFGLLGRFSRDVNSHLLPTTPTTLTSLASLWKVATGAASYTFRSVGTAGGELTKTHTSAEVTQNGGFARESPQNPLKFRFRN